ncbi:MAG TPA: prepilin-type N-terminal cleavage/methylation domain-containing protein [Thermodesulfovibrionales bacterium]|nr:prepilin-type N-terminal cleavage/methylation domain-containing protein [Thermodesulfovibrionales bacterium]
MTTKCGLDDCSSNPSKAGGGFTLLELMVVIFVISVVLTIVLPSFTSIGESRITSEAKRLGSIIRYLNDSAISTKETLQMKINLGDKVVSYSGPDGDKSERFDDISTVELQSKGGVSEGEVTVFFGPMGARESFTINLKRGDSDMGISLNSASGRVKIKLKEEL